MNIRLSSCPGGVSCELALNPFWWQHDHVRLTLVGCLIGAIDAVQEIDEKVLQAPSLVCLMWNCRNWNEKVEDEPQMFIDKWNLLHGETVDLVVDCTYWLVSSPLNARGSQSTTAEPEPAEPPTDDALFSKFTTLVHHLLGVISLLALLRLQFW